MRLYSTHDVLNSLLASGFKIIKAGTRRDLVRLALSPFALVAGTLRGSPWNRSLWDFFGFAEFVYAQKHGALSGSSGEKRLPAQPGPEAGNVEGSQH